MVAISLVSGLSACAEYVGHHRLGAVASTSLSPAPERLTRHIIRKSDMAPKPQQRPSFDGEQVAQHGGASSLSDAADAFSNAASRAPSQADRDFEEASIDPLATPEATSAMRRLPVTPQSDEFLAQAGAAERNPGSRAGIFGTVTDSDELIVNGIRLGPEARGDRDIHVGDVVAIEATETNGMISASSIEEIHALIGPMSDEVPVGAAHELTVMGVPVTLASGGKIIDAKTRAVMDSYALSVGDRLAVSGLWQGDAVIADRIEKLPEDGPDQISGAYRSAATGAFIGPLAIEGRVNPASASEQFARASGRFENGRFIASNMSIGIPKALATPGARLSIEGFLRSGGSSGMLGYRIDGLGLELDSQAAPSVQIAGGRAILIGEAAKDTGAIFMANRGVALPNAFDRRLQILQQIDDGFAPHNADPLR